jgi:hypothetical protein
MFTSDDVPPGDESAVTNIISFVEARAKLMPPAEGEFDIDALLAEHDLDRAWLDQFYADTVTNEAKQAPRVAAWREEINVIRSLRVQQQQVLDQLQADVARFLDLERGLDKQLATEKCRALNRIWNGPEEEPEQPKGRRKRK